MDSVGRWGMFAEKSWGSYRVLDDSDNSMPVKVTLTSGHGMNCHSHERRDEVLTFWAEGSDNPSGDILDWISRHSFF